MINACTRKSLFGVRRGGMVNMTRHQPPSRDLNTTLSAPFNHQFDITRKIVVAKKCLSTTVATLSDVVWIAKSCCTCYSRHAGNISILRSDYQ